MPCEQQLQPNEVNGVKESWDMLKMYLIFHLDLYMKINHRRNLTKRQALFLMNMRRWTFYPADISTCGSNSTVVANNINDGSILFKCPS